jgi:hypothetical protein
MIYIVCALDIFCILEIITYSNSIFLNQISISILFPLFKENVGIS